MSRVAFFKALGSYFLASLFHRGIAVFQKLTVSCFSTRLYLFSYFHHTNFPEILMHVETVRTRLSFPPTKESLGSRLGPLLARLLYRRHLSTLHKPHPLEWCNVRPGFACASASARFGLRTVLTTISIRVHPHFPCMKLHRKKDRHEKHSMNT